jgi:hypothetical protein
VRHTCQFLVLVDDATPFGLTQHSIAKVEMLKRKLAEIMPAGNLPVFLLQALLR